MEDVLEKQLRWEIDNLHIALNAANKALVDMGKRKLTVAGVVSLGKDYDEALSIVSINETDGGIVISVFGG